MTPTTIAQALDWGADQLSHVDGPARLDAEVLLAHALKTGRTHLATWPDQAVAQDAWRTFAALIDQRQKNIPVAYLVGTRAFWSHELTVTAATLIPRPETELLVEHCLQRIPSDQNWQIADLGTGTGAIAIAIAGERPNCWITACDVSSDALLVATDNANRLKINNVTFIHSDWMLNLPSISFDLIVSNPPYLAANDIHLTQGDVQHEPKSALVSGPTGLEAIALIAEQSVGRLQINGWLLIEHGYQQGEAVAALLIANGFTHVETITDLAGLQRITLGQHK